MAETMQDIRRRMRTVESTQHITHAMRLVSAARFRRSKQQYDRISMKLEKTVQVMGNVLARRGIQAQDGAVPVRLIILFTSSRGLCGAYNSSLLKTAAAVSSPGDVFCTVGSRGGDFFRRQGYSILYDLEDGPEKMTIQDAAEAVSLILEEWQRGRLSEVHLIHMCYVNALRQEPQVKRLLPLDRKENGDTEPVISEDLEFHPSEKQVLSCLLIKYLQLVLWTAAVETSVCEHAARRAAMEAASESAGDMLKTLSLSHNRMRQQAVTDELIEIVSGAESLK